MLGNAIFLFKEILVQDRFNSETSCTLISELDFILSTSDDALSVFWLSWPTSPTSRVDGAERETVGVF